MILAPKTFLWALDYGKIVGSQYAGDDLRDEKAFWPIHMDEDLGHFAHINEGCWKKILVDKNNLYAFWWLGKDKEGNLLTPPNPTVYIVPLKEIKRLRVQRTCELPRKVPHPPAEKPS